MGPSRKISIEYQHSKRFSAKDSTAFNEMHCSFSFSPTFEKQAPFQWCDEENFKTENNFQYLVSDKYCIAVCCALFKIFKNLYNILNFSFNAAPTITIDQIFAKMIPENVGTLFHEKPNLIHSTIWKFYWVSVKQLLLPIYIICEANKFFSSPAQ